MTNGVQEEGKRTWPRLRVNPWQDLQLSLEEDKERTNEVNAQGMLQAPWLSDSVTSGMEKIDYMSSQPDSCKFPSKRYKEYINST